jgi:subtilisin family serine protease
LNFSEVSLVGEDSKSGMGHGTGIASIIAGQTEGFLGLAPASEILSVQVLGKDGVGRFIYDC